MTEYPGSARQPEEGSQNVAPAEEMVNVEMKNHEIECSACGAVLQAGDACCPVCGAQAPVEPEAPMSVPDTPAAEPAPAQKPAEPQPAKLVDGVACCPVCGGPLDPDETVCGDCGTPVCFTPAKPVEAPAPVQKPDGPLEVKVVNGEALCPVCGGPLGPGAEVCADCGASVRIIGETPVSAPVAYTAPVRPASAQPVPPAASPMAQPDGKNAAVCPKCHCPLDAGQTVCPICGETVAAPAAAKAAGKNPAKKPAAPVFSKENLNKYGVWLAMFVGLALPVLGFIFYAVKGKEWKWAGKPLLVFSVCGVAGWLLSLLIGLILHAGFLIVIAALAPVTALLVWLGLQAKKG